MKFETVRYLTEIIGITAIVGSLVFVGLQMKQTHEIALVTLYQMRSDAARELATSQIDTEVLLSIQKKRMDGIELSGYERYLVNLPPFILFNHFENSHYLYQQGFLTAEHWRSDLRTIRGIVKAQSDYAKYWSGAKSTFRKSYAEVIERALEADDT